MLLLGGGGFDETGKGEETGWWEFHCPLNNKRKAHFRGRGRLNCLQDNSFAKLIIQTAGSPVHEIVSLIIERIWPSLFPVAT